MIVRTNAHPYLSRALKVVYLVHLVLVLAFTVYFISQHPHVVSFSITFSMLLIYGGMLLWSFLLTYLFIVNPTLCSSATARRRQWSSPAS